MTEDVKNADANAPKKLSIQRRTNTTVSSTTAGGKAKAVQVEVRKKRTVPTDAARKAAEAGARSHAMHLGGKFNFPFGSIRLTPAFHGSGVPGGHAAGVIIEFFGKRVYFAGDTALFSDMKLISRHGEIDYALLPIGDNFTMGVEDAVTAASWIQANTTIPIHYKTWPVIDKEPATFVALLEAKHKQAGLVVDPGQTIEL